MKSKIEVINKSIGAAFLISLGNFALLKLGAPIGPVIFAFGLLGVCYLGQNLFTGKCGFIFEDKAWLNLLIILIVNLIFGYIFGIMYRYTDPEVVKAAVAKVDTWDISLAYFFKSFLCGTIMYLAVKMYKVGTPLGIIFGIPLFIFSGFQHCIANVVTMGVALCFHPALIIAIIGNFVGSIFIWYVSKDIDVKKKTKRTKK